MRRARNTPEAETGSHTGSKSQLWGTQNTKATRLFSSSLHFQITSRNNLWPQVEHSQDVCVLKEITWRLKQKTLALAQHYCELKVWLDLILGYKQANHPKQSVSMNLLSTVSPQLNKCIDFHYTVDNI